MASPGPRRLRRRRLLKIAAVAAPVFAAGGGYCWHSNRLDVQHLTAPRKLGLARRLRLAVVSDLHAPRFTFPIEELTARVDEAGCDLVLLTGDTVDRAGNESLVPGLLGGLRAAAGKLAILGNWEYWGGLDLRALRRRYEGIGVRLLVNESFTLPWHGTDIAIVGLDDLLGGDPRPELLAQVPRATPAIVLSHCPATADRIARMDRDPTLVFSGHTHGGQIAPFGLAPVRPRGSGAYVKGWYRVGRGCDLYVSPGLGNVIVPFRIGARPTLAIVDVT